MSEMDNKCKKPPIGIIPKNIAIAKYKSDRIDDIFDAMERYSNANEVIPIEWIIELRELLPYSLVEDNVLATKFWEEYQESNMDHSND